MGSQGSSELCRDLELLATASVAIDGSKFKAVNNRDKNFTKVKVEQLEESVARYLAQLDTADRHLPALAISSPFRALAGLAILPCNLLPRWGAGRSSGRGMFMGPLLRCYC